MTIVVCYRRESRDYAQRLIYWKKDLDPVAKLIIADACLLLAGVESIVGTLWEVRSDTTRAFFVELYRELAKNRSRRDAFRKAQLHLRKRFPHPSDWGAFYLLGAWD